MDLFPVLFSRLSRQDELKPVFIGQYAGVEGLPKIDYPPIYYWMDTARGVTLLSFNEPLLRKVCYLEAFDQDLVGDMNEEVMSDINEALERLRSVTQAAFVHSFEVAQQEQNKARVPAPSIFYRLWKSLSKLFR